MTHVHNVYDTDTHFSINPITKALKNKSSGKTSLIQHDHNSERFTFEIPRIIEGHDMSLCNAVQVHFNNIDVQTKEQNKGVYPVIDLKVDPENDELVTLSWLISKTATKFVGPLHFLIRFSCVAKDGTVVYVWNTAVYAGISVSNGIDNSEEYDEEEYVDLLEGWHQELLSSAEEGVNVVAAEGTRWVEEISKTAQEKETEIAQAVENGKNDINTDKSAAIQSIDEKTSAAIQSIDEKTNEETAKIESAAKEAANEAKKEIQGHSALAATYAQQSSESANAAQTAKNAAENAASRAEASAKNAENATLNMRNQFANALKGHKTGTAISADDVSPVEHELDIKITGENVEGTKVTRLGKNFANLAGLPETKKYKAVTNITSGYEIDTKNNIIITTSPTEAGGYTYISTSINLSELCPEARVGMTLRFSAIDSYSEGASKGNVIIYLSQAAVAWAFSETAKAITITQNMLDSDVIFYASPTTNAVRIISNFQIELGENATEYEPYIDPVEAIADAEGDVKGLMSLSPNMTLITDNESAVIECAYNRDADKVITDIETKLNTLIATIGG